MPGFRSHNAFFETAFLITLPGLLLTLTGSTLLGIALLRNGEAPSLPPWLLALAIPLAIGIAQVTSMGNMALPIVFAFLLGLRVAREPSYAQVVGATTPA